MKQDGQSVSLKWPFQQKIAANSKNENIVVFAWKKAKGEFNNFPTWNNCHLKKWLSFYLLQLWDVVFCNYFSLQKKKH